MINKGVKRLKLYGYWGEYTGEIDEKFRANGLGIWKRSDDDIWVGLFKDDGGHGRLTFYQ